MAGQSYSSSRSSLGTAALPRSSATVRSTDNAVLTNAAGAKVAYWLVQGVALGAVGGSIVSAIVIGSVLGLRALLGG